MTRLRPWLFPLLLLQLAACSVAPDRESTPDAGSNDAGADSQTRYSYPGCEDAGTAYCAKDKVMYCMLQKVRSKYDACSTDEDCVLAAGPSDCIQFWSCAPDAVSDAGRAAYLSEVSAEIANYCADPGCIEFGDCAPMGTPVPRCLTGHCRVTFEPDAGATDSGM